VDAFWRLRLPLSDSQYAHAPAKETIKVARPLIRATTPAHRVGLHTFPTALAPPRATSLLVPNRCCITIPLSGFSAPHPLRRNTSQIDPGRNASGALPAPIPVPPPSSRLHKLWLDSVPEKVLDTDAFRRIPSPPRHPFIAPLESTVPLVGRVSSHDPALSHFASVYLVFPNHDSRLAPVRSSTSG